MNTLKTLSVATIIALMPVMANADPYRDEIARVEAMMRQDELNSQLRQLREAQEKQVELQQQLLDQQKKQYDDAHYEACRQIYLRQRGGTWPC